MGRSSTWSIVRGPSPTDYALFISGRLLGILEAKRVAADAVTELEAVIDDLKEIVELIAKEEGVGK